MRGHSRLVARGRARPRLVAGRRIARPAPTAAPIVKWAGGKTKLVNELLARVPASFVRYHEPFVGGGALFFQLSPRSAVLSDLNADLIGTYETVRDDVEGVIRLLERHRRLHSEAHYYAVRDAWNDHAAQMSRIERAAAFLYLNKTCYNGLWRVNRSGAFNVPMGRYANPTIYHADALRAAARALSCATLSTAPFEAVLDHAGPGDFVYFDPPYVPASETADFTSYTADRFDMADQERLARVFRELDDRGCAVMLSNSDTPLVRRLYAGYRIDRVFCPRAINSRPDARTPVAEVIVTNRF